VVLVGHLQPLEVSKQVPLNELPILRLPIKPVCGNRIFEKRWRYSEYQPIFGSFFEKPKHETVETTTK
jgi:hypothetical protein